MRLDTTLGTAPNHTTFRGEVRLDSVKGITTSQWNPKTGGLSTTIFTGTQFEITNLANQAQSLGYEYKIAGGAKWKIEVTYPVDIIVNSTNEEPTPLTIWELQFQQIEQSVYECKDRVIAASLIPADIYAIDSKLRTNSDNTVPSFAYPPNSGYGTIVYNLKKSGVEGRQKFVPVLKRTLVTSNNNLQNINWYPEFESKLFTTQALLKTYNTNTNQLSNMPVGVTKQLPETLNVSFYHYISPTNQNFVYNQPVSGFFLDSASLLVFFVGWLQYPIEVQTLSPQKVQLSQYWVFNQWSGGILGLYDPANVSPNSLVPDPGIPLLNSPGTMINQIPAFNLLVQ